MLAGDKSTSADLTIADYGADETLIRPSTANLLGLTIEKDFGHEDQFIDSFSSEGTEGEGIKGRRYTPKDVLGPDIACSLQGQPAVPLDGITAADVRDELIGMDILKQHIAILGPRNLITVFPSDSPLQHLHDPAKKELIISGIHRLLSRASLPASSASSSTSSRASSGDTATVSPLSATAHIPHDSDKEARRQRPKTAKCEEPTARLSDTSELGARCQCVIM